MEKDIFYTNEKYLDKRLLQYVKEDYYPFHMPGHKRQLEADWNPYEIDITEIEGFDNLHAPEEILQEAEERAAKLYGSKQSYYLINGSTCGILTAVSAAVKYGGKLLMARNCHKAVYHAAYLRNLQTRYLYPYITDEGIQGVISPRSVKEALERESDIDAVIITSPTYDGMVSDISAIAELVHGYGIPLLVDEAHGAHFGLHPAFPKSAVTLGADLVIQSMHKTLPSLTQTALLHQCSDLIDEAKIKRYLDIYETSSPSYVLMAGMDKCIRMIEEKKEALFDIYVKELYNFYEKSKKLKQIRVFLPRQENSEGYYLTDPSKIRISAAACGLNGKELYDILLNKYHLQLEMCSGDYALAMTSCMDNKEGFERLINALYEIDEYESNRSIQEKDVNTSNSAAARLDRSKNHLQLEFVRSIYTQPAKCIEITAAWEKDKKEASLAEAVGCVSADFVSLYPPGIPILVPGERITGEMTEQLKLCIIYGLNIQGIDERLRINVVN